MAYEKKNIKMYEYDQLPYTVVGSTSLPQEFHMCFKVVGLKKLIENCHDEDLVHITSYATNKKTKFEISKYIKK